MKNLIFLFLMLVVVNCREITVKNLEARIAFEDFKIKNNHTFNSTRDEYKAFLNFKETYKFIDICNTEYDQGNSTFKCNVNTFADESDAFFADQLNDLLEEEFSMRGDEEYPEVPECQLEYLNYSAMGYPSKIKNQGRCGACWAFAATGVCEAAIFKKTKKLVKFSEQQLVDCTQNDDYNNYGCRGGRISAGMQYLQAFGAMNESEYTPYSQRDNNTCLQSDDRIIAKIKSFSRLLKVEEDYLKNLLCEVGPVTVAIDGSSRGFQFYSSGIFNDPTCRNYINHAMVIRVVIRI
ncbi:hypothetical protein ACKWTF_016277 [Chironomus riparius]